MTTETLQVYGVVAAAVTRRFPDYDWTDADASPESNITNDDVVEFITLAAGHVSAALVAVGIEPAALTLADYPAGYRVAQDYIARWCEAEIQRIMRPERVEVWSVLSEQAAGLLDKIRTDPHVFGKIAADEQASPRVATSTQTVGSRYPNNRPRRKFGGVMKW
jgi:hypothetical protein